MSFFEIIYIVLLYNFANLVGRYLFPSIYYNDIQEELEELNNQIKILIKKIEINNTEIKLLKAKIYNHIE